MAQPPLSPSVWLFAYFLFCFVLKVKSSQRSAVRSPRWASLISPASRCLALLMSPKPCCPPLLRQLVSSVPVKVPAIFQPLGNFLIGTWPVSRCWPVINSAANCTYLVMSAGSRCRAPAAFDQHPGPAWVIGVVVLTNHLHLFVSDWCSQTIRNFLSENIPW